MDTLTQETFDQLIELDIETMSDEQLGFLMARRSYMNASQKERFAKTIKLHEEGKLFKKAKTASKVEDDEEEVEEEEEAPKTKGKGKGK